MRVLLPAILVVLGCGGGDGHGPCPERDLELRAFEGDPVTTNEMSCSDVGWCPWQEPARLAVISECESARALILAWHVGGHLRLQFELDGDLVVGVRALSSNGCDTDGCTTYYSEPAEGWVRLEEGNVNGRLRGRYELHFRPPSLAHLGTIAGSFDVGASADAGPR